MSRRLRQYGVLQRDTKELGVPDGVISVLAGQDTRLNPRTLTRDSQQILMLRGFLSAR